MISHPHVMRPPCGSFQIHAMQGNREDNEALQHFLLGFFIVKDHVLFAFCEDIFLIGV